MHWMKVSPSSQWDWSSADDPSPRPHLPSFLLSPGIKCNSNSMEAEAAKKTYRDVHVDMSENKNLMFYETITV